MKNIFPSLVLLDSLQITFIVIVSVIAGLLLIVLISIPAIKYFRKKKYRELSYLKIKDVVLNNDYYLINNFRFKIDDKKTVLIDHIIGGEKYFYIISDYYYGRGSLTGRVEDQSLIFENSKGKKSYTDNPVLENKKLLSRLSNVTGIEPSLMVGLVLVNNSCPVSIQSNSKQFYIIQKKQLAPLIKAIESRNISEINANELAYAFKILDELNIK